MGKAERQEGRCRCASRGKAWGWSLSVHRRGAGEAVGEPREHQRALYTSDGEKLVPPLQHIGSISMWGVSVEHLGLDIDIVRTGEDTQPKCPSKEAVREGAVT